MDIINDVRPCDWKHIIISLQWSSMIRKIRPTKITFVQFMPLNHGTPKNQQQISMKLKSNFKEVSKGLTWHHQLTRSALGAVSWGFQSDADAPRTDLAFYFLHPLTLVWRRHVEIHPPGQDAMGWEAVEASLIKIRFQLISANWILIPCLRRLYYFWWEQQAQQHKQLAGQSRLRSRWCQLIEIMRKSVIWFGLDRYHG